MYFGKGRVVALVSFFIRSMPSRNSAMWTEADGRSSSRVEQSCEAFATIVPT